VEEERKALGIKGIEFCTENQFICLVLGLGYASAQISKVSRSAACTFTVSLEKPSDDDDDDDYSTKKYLPYSFDS
jgi:hypothetical protein